MVGRWSVRVAVLATWLVLSNTPGLALYVDEGQNFQLRLRTYSRFSVRTEDSDRGATNPSTQMGQMVEHRNFYNPEFEGKLTPYLPDWLGIFKPDDLSFRVAAWGFYDGISSKVLLSAPASGVPFLWLSISRVRKCRIHATSTVPAGG